MQSGGSHDRLGRRLTFYVTDTCGGPRSVNHVFVFDLVSTHSSPLAYSERWTRHLMLAPHGSQVVPQTP